MSIIPPKEFLSYIQDLKQLLDKPEEYLPKKKRHYNPEYYARNKEMFRRIHAKYMAKRKLRNVV